ncbi:MAG: glycoside hydrolase family 97 protein [Bacteroidales bacterium]|nr:glycoside hydrolase family 97 protein [Bacteroidales bacterium]
MKRPFVLLLLLAAATIACAGQSPELLKSPDGRMEMRFELRDGKPYYSLYRGGKPVVQPSRMGFTLEWRKSDLASGFRIADAQYNTFDEVWHPVWGEEANIRNHYNELAVTLQQDFYLDHEGKRVDKPTVMVIRFRLYDDGLGFRYEWPQKAESEKWKAESKADAASTNALTQSHNNAITNSLVTFWLTDELTEFRMTGDHTAWWIPGDYDTQEFNYTQSRLSQVRELHDNPHLTGGWPWKSFSNTGLQTALQLKTDDGLYINIHEAAVLDFPTMNLDLNENTFSLKVHLTPDATGYVGRLQSPCYSPWRTVQVCESATDVLRSRLILNLNEPCALEDVSWIHPVKYMGVWWEMISDHSTWGYTNDFPAVRLPGDPSLPPSLQGSVTDYTKAKPHGRHGANNANVRRYIDFAAEHGFDALLIEGWNIGWEDWYGKDKDYVFDFQTPYPDFDLPALNEYAHRKGIRLIMHHESSSSVSNYERFMEPAYNLMNRYGYDAVKSGYVGRIVPHGEHHYSQPIINHYHRAIVEAAKHHIMVNAHEAVRPTGLCRTWPNMIGNESAMGTEFRGRILPGHTTILPFTRLQGGPMDYTPGIFETDMEKNAPWNRDLMRHTICNQLGLYVTFYSPLQMAADFPEHYQPHMGAFQFIKDVAVDWDTSIYIAAEIGDYIVTARHPKTSTLNLAADGVGTLADGKKGVISNAARFVYGLDEANGVNGLDGLTPRDTWYIGGVTDEQAREVEVKLDFLKPGVKYEATIYADAKDASGYVSDVHIGWEAAQKEGYNPKAYTITKKTVTSKSKLKLRMAPCGGFAVSIREIRK